MSNPIQDRLLILEVMLTTQQSQNHTYPISYNPSDPSSIANAFKEVKTIMDQIALLLTGQTQAFENPMILYNPAHVVGVRISSENAEELQEVIVQEQRRIGFAT